MFTLVCLMFRNSVFTGIFVLLCVAPTAAQVNPDSGLVAFWPFTGNPADSSGFGRNAIIFGAVLCADRHGMQDRAYCFNGTNAYMSVADDPVWPTARRPFSVALWMRLDIDRGTYIIGQSEGTGNQRKWLLWYTGSREFIFHYNGTAVGIRYPVYQYRWAPVAARWYHITCTRSDSLYSLYVNGVFYAAGTDADTLPNVGGPLTIGMVEGGGYVSGALDNIRFYNRALSTLEVQELYRRESTIVSVELLDRRMPTRYELSQNHPNPFNPETKIKLSASKLQPRVIEGVRSSRSRSGHSCE